MQLQYIVLQILITSPICNLLRW